MRSSPRRSYGTTPCWSSPSTSTAAGQYGAHTFAPAAIAAPPDLNGYTPWDGFAFDRLGLRVPTIMVSPYIKANTIINTPLSHTSFLKSVHEKWNLGSLSTREDASPYFHDTGVLQPTLQRQTMADMPVLLAPLIPPDHTDYSKAVLSALAKAIMDLVKQLWCKAFPDDCPVGEIITHEDAAAFLHHSIRSAKLRRGQLEEAAAGEIHEKDSVLLFRAIAERLAVNKLR